MERLQKVIANAGYTSRRKAEELIKEKKVQVNGQIVEELGYKVLDKDEIIVDGILLETNAKVYYLLNKPRGVVSTTNDEKGRKTVVDLIDTNIRIYPVGRLDYDTTGLLILTNDGELSNLLTHPKNNIEKKYIAKIGGKLDIGDLKKLKSGVIIDNVKTRPCFAKIKSYDKKSNVSKIELIIHEGKNHQVKKMFEVLGYEVLKLKREQVAFLTLDKVPSGHYRKLNIKEVKRLYGLVNSAK